MTGMQRMADAIVEVVLLVVTVATVIFIGTQINGCAKSEPAQVERANGCPLDAIAYDAPVFARTHVRSDSCYRVTDRLSGSQWWLIQIGTRWVVLPIEGEEAADVG